MGISNRQTKHMSSGSFERKIVLSNAHDDYFFAARTVPRFDVQEAFTDLGMNLVESGFTSIVSANALEKGSYHMGLIFTHIGDGKEFFVDANRCMTLTEDGLVLVVAWHTRLSLSVPLISKKQPNDPLFI